MDDQLVMERIADNDEAAFEQLFRGHYAALCGYANKYLGDLDMAEEIVQEFFCQLWDKRESLEVKSSPRSYLYSAVRNRCLNHFRHLKVQEAHQQETMATNGHLGSVTALDDLQEMELDRKIAQVIEALPEQCQRIFTMSRQEGLKYKEIADQLGVSVKAVEAQVSKALGVLRKELRDYMPLIMWWLLNN